MSMSCVNCFPLKKSLSYLGKTYVQLKGLPSAWMPGLPGEEGTEGSVPATAGDTAREKWKVVVLLFNTAGFNQYMDETRNCKKHQGGGVFFWPFHGWGEE